MKRARCDEQDMVGLDRPVFGGHGCAFDQGQQVTLHAFAGNVGTTGIGAGANLVDLVQKHDTVLFNRFHRCFGYGFIIQQFVGLFGDQYIIAFSDSNLFLYGPATHGFAEQIAKVHHAAHTAGLTGNFETTHGIGCICQFQFDDRIVQFARF